jgi:hypothetical protein
MGYGTCPVSAITVSKEEESGELNGQAIAGLGEIFDDMMSRVGSNTYSTSSNFSNAAKSDICLPFPLHVGYGYIVQLAHLLFRHSFSYRIPCWKT